MNRAQDKQWKVGFGKDAKLRSSRSYTFLKCGQATLFFKIYLSTNQAFPVINDGSEN